MKPEKIIQTIPLRNRTLTLTWLGARVESVAITPREQPQKPFTMQMAGA